MPIGSSKLGVLGAGLVPGGSVTFNAPGTWAVPPGVKKVSITGRGGTGNPGVAGNPGNPGNPGSGAGGGGSALSRSPTNQPNATELGGRAGGAAFKLNGPIANGSPGACANWNSWGPNAQGSCQYTSGGRGSTGLPNPDATAGQSGQSGNAGSAGQAGQAGNTGQPSSALGNTFPGGAGGNAPPGGNAGNAGSGGQGGGGGLYSPTFAGGAAGNGGGAGATGGTYGPTGNIPQGPPSQNLFRVAILGGGGAGVVNSGQSGPNNNLCGRVWGNTPPIPPSAPPFRTPGDSYAIAGGTGNPQVTSPSPLPPSPSFGPTLGPVINPALNTMQGGLGTAPPTAPGRGGGGGFSGWVWKLFCDLTPAPSFNSAGRTHLNGPCSSFNNASLRQEVLRAGGGGGGNGCTCAGKGPVDNMAFGGAGGGGGRGNAGNAGGPSPTVSGTAGTPQTFNCVNVTPGTPTPITVGAPGGQIVISWNPQ